MPLCDTQIKSLIKQGYIKNASSSLQESNVISYGVTSYGYDPKLGTKFKIMESGIAPLDPKAEIPPYAFRDFESTEPFVVPPNTFFMGYTEEWFHIPRNTLVHVTGKSTYARLGLTTYVTPLEPDWKGHVTLEFRTAERPVVIYPGEGICQFVYLNSEDICAVSYADRKGKYMDQKMEVTHAKVRGTDDAAPDLVAEYAAEHPLIQNPNYDPEDLTALMPNNETGIISLADACGAVTNIGRAYVDGLMEACKRRAEVIEDTADRKESDPSRDQVRELQDIITERLAAFENGEVPTAAPDYDPTEEACALMSDLVNKLNTSENKNNVNLNTDKIDD